MVNLDCLPDNFCVCARARVDGLNARTGLQGVVEDTRAVPESSDAVGTHWKAVSTEVDAAFQEEGDG